MTAEQSDDDVCTPRARRGASPRNILSRAPVNGTAARVLGGGYKYESRKKVLTAASPVPLPIRRITSAIRRDPYFTDLSGHRFGKFRVLGLAERNGYWVVRCDCGTYAQRSTKAVRNPSNDADCCEQCRHLIYLKRTDHWRQTGKNKPIKEFV